MEKLLAVLTAVLLAIGFSTVGLAGEPNLIGYAYYHDTMLKAVEARYETNINDLGACSIGEAYSGMIAWVDRDDHRIMVIGEDGSKIFDVSGAETKGRLKADQVVIVRYTVSNGEMIASSITEVPKKVAWEYIYGY